MQAEVLFGKQNTTYYLVWKEVIFGNNVREDVVSSIRNDKGQITDNEGYPADLRLTQRGWNIYGNVGYVISKLGHNPNSGVFFTVGGGWMQHKVNLYDANKKVAAVNGDLKKVMTD